MGPLLRATADGREYRLREITDLLADQYSLTDEDQKELLPSGGEPRFYNRVRWAAGYLRHAGLLLGTGRGAFKITPRGLNALQDWEKIDSKYLSQFDEFREFKARSRKAKGEQEVLETVADDVSATPEELLESNYQTLRDALTQEILDRIAECSPTFFERLVVDLLVKMGYGGSRKDAGEAIGRSGDDGIDGVINEDRLGLDVVHIQAKRWKNTVGRPDVQSFAGSLEGNRSRKGVFITTSNFSQEARDYVKRIEKKIILIDGDTLANLMIDYRVGVSEVASYSVCKVDLDYYEQ